MKRDPVLSPERESGLTLIEILVGLVAASLVLAGAYSIWLTHQQQGYRLEKKMDLRNQITLSSKKIQRSITLAGLGLHGGANLGKTEATGSDTLIIYTNMTEAHSDLGSDYSHSTAQLTVSDASIFAGASYVVVASSDSGEIRHIDSRSGSTLVLDSPFNRDYFKDSVKAYPAARERYFTDQSSNQLIWEAGGASTLLGKDIRNFQVVFHDKHGASTDIPSEARTVQFSFTGIFPAPQGALTSLVFSSIAIPRNTL